MKATAPVSALLVVLALLAITAAQILMNLPEDVAVDTDSEAAVESIRAGVVRDHDGRRAT